MGKKSEQKCSARAWLDGHRGPVPAQDPWWRIKSWRSLAEIEAQYHHTNTVFIMIEDAPIRIKEGDNEDSIVVEYLVTTNIDTAKKRFPWQ